MFKRVEKHRQKKEDADKLDLDDRWQDILGFHDTDSEESASDSEDTDNDEDEMQTSDNRKTVDDSEDEEDEDEGREPEVKACIICPGKVLKGSKMEESHLASNAHVRRFKHFNGLATDAKPTASARKLFRSFTKKDPNESSTNPTSKRAEKRHIYHVRQKERREKFKVRMAKKAEQTILSVPGPVEPKLPTQNEVKPSNKPRPIGDFAKTEVEKPSQIKKKRKIKESHPAAPSKISSPKRQKTMAKATNDESDEEKTMVTRIVTSTADGQKKLASKR